MRLCADLLRRLRSLFRAGREDAETRQELRLHLEMETEKNVSAGMDPREAHRQACLRLGGADGIREAVRDARGLRPLEDLLSDLGRGIRRGMRGLRRSPGFTLTVVIVLALGTGANTALFSVLDAVWLRAVPYPQAERMVLVSSSTQFSERGSPSWPEFEDWRTGTDVFEHLVAIERRPGLLGGVAEPERVTITGLYGDLFAVFGESAVAGRLFREPVGAPASDDVVVLSHETWLRRFNGDPSIAGQTVLLDDLPVTVLGVLPARFSAVIRGDLFQAIRPPAEARRGIRGPLSAVGRLRSSVSLAQAQASMDTVAQRLAVEHPWSNARRGIVLTPLRDALIGAEVGRMLWLLAAAAGLVLLIACVNVANLLLAGMAPRARELAVCAALGASRGRLIRQLLTESVLLSAVGTIVGVACVWLTRDALVALIPPRIPRLAEIGVDGRVLTFAVAVSVLTMSIVGVIPALRLSNVRPMGVVASPGLPRRRFGASATLLFTEVGLAVVVIVAAGLLLSSFMRLVSVDLGFEPRNVVTFDLSIPGGGDDLRARFFGSPEQAAALQNVRDELLRLPGVEAVGAVDSLPLAGGGVWYSIEFEGRPAAPPGGEPMIDLRRAAPGYFEAMRIPLIRGRTLTDGDHADAPGAGVVNEAAARRFWPGEDPIGQRIQLGGNEPLTIVGIVGDIRHVGFHSDPEPEVYWSWYQHPADPTVVVRTAGSPTPLVRELEARGRGILSGLSVSSVRTLDDLAFRSVAEPRFRTLLLALMAVLVLVLTIVGVASLTARAVALRMKEIGIRVTIGARPGQIVALMLGSALAPVVAGAVIGLLAATWTSRFLGHFLFEVGPIDPAVYVAAVALLLVSTLVAAWLPARRAAYLDPMVTLRAE